MGGIENNETNTAFSQKYLSRLTFRTLRDVGWESTQKTKSLGCGGFRGHLRETEHILKM